MKFVLQQKLLSIGNDYSVFNDSGSQVYYFDGKVLAIGTKIIVQSAAGSQIALIRRKFFTFNHTFSVRDASGVIAVIYKKRFSLRKSFVIDVPGPDDITIVGEVLEHNYNFLRNGHTIAKVTKQWFKGQDTYGIDVESDNDTLLVLSATVIIDMICHPKRDSGFKSSKS